jgi:hypothetical protein
MHPGMHGGLRIPKGIREEGLREGDFTVDENWIVKHRVTHKTERQYVIRTVYYNIRGRHAQLSLQTCITFTAFNNSNCLESRIHEILGRLQRSIPFYRLDQRPLTSDTMRTHFSDRMPDFDV